MSTQGRHSVKNKAESAQWNGMSSLGTRAFCCYGGPFSHHQNSHFHLVMEKTKKPNQSKKNALQFTDQMNKKQSQIYISINTSLNLLILRSDFQWLHHFSILFEPFMCLLKCQFVISLVPLNYVLFSQWYHCGNTYIFSSFIRLRVNTDHLFCNFIRSLKLSFIYRGLNKEFMHALEERFLLLCNPESTHGCKYFTGFIDRGLSLKSRLTEIELVSGLYNYDH